MPNATFIHTTARPWAHQWYNLVGNETSRAGSAIAAGGIRPMPDMTLESLLDAIKQFPQRSLRTIITVHHGNPNGIIIPLTGSTAVGASGGLLDRLRGSLSEDEATLAGHIQQAPGGSGVQAADIGRLRKKMTDVQGWGIESLEIRACNIGGNDATMQSIGRFFGVRFVCAPQHPDFFGRATTIQYHDSSTQAGRTAMSRFLALPGTQRYPLRTPRVYYRITRQTNSTYSVDVQAQAGDHVREEHVRAWMADHFAVSGSFQPQAVPTPLPLHGLLVPRGGMVHLPLSHNYEGGLILPGMSDYTANLRQVTITSGSTGGLVP